MRREQSLHNILDWLDLYRCQRTTLIQKPNHLIATMRSECGRGWSKLRQTWELRASRRRAPAGRPDHRALHDSRRQLPD
jgi:hypothetical protein